MNAHTPAAVIRISATEQAASDLSMMKKWIQRDFGESEKSIINVCTGCADGVPAFVHHVRMLAAFLHPHISHSEFEELAATYTYMSAMYYSIDASFDTQKAPASDSPGYGSVSDIARLAVMATIRLHRFVRNFDETVSILVVNQFTVALADAQKALSEENCYRSSKDVEYCEKREFFHMWGRSNAFLFLAQALAASARGALDEHVEATIKRFLFLTQFADDIVDWRDDFASANWTPFLRKCRSAITEPHSLERFEEAILLGGMYEQGLSEVISGLTDIATNLKEANHQLFRSAIQRRVSVAAEHLESLLQIKAEH
ncbi:MULTISPECIES: hypothetical protein [unclassified Caballeronia]|uniref:hypothetical protein n=1 Tax=unclassified Caballeronia TaxID=2646786 RepID=UPI002854B2F4|nr:MULTISPECIES: hypothetical protein [unclassified Caballeronia]MDR5777260.1 hypothetical protein [Caballeronia sp. LZ002]MDR5798890.1 hypothetical protein [Caballeronia sp. LZ001]MDR5852698.1 hypothetical protein [Caballeronia sp. LZ003]